MNKTRANDLDVYLACFDAFAADKSEIASETGLGKAQVTKSLNRLHDADLVAEGYDVNAEAQGSSRRGQYKELVFQCYATYDSISRDEAIVLFERKMPAESAKPASKPKAAAKPATDKKVPLTNSRRRALLRLSKGRVAEDSLNDLNRRPYDFFVAEGLAEQESTKDGVSHFSLTEAGRDRAADIDAAKYGEVK